MRVYVARAGRGGAVMSSAQRAAASVADACLKCVPSRCLGQGDPCARMCPRPSSLKSWLLDEGCAVERREALGIAEHGLGLRSDERRVVKESRSRWAPDH